MRKKTSLGTKLVGGFVVAALVTLVVGVVGWRGAKGLTSSIHEIGVVRLPSVQSLLEIESALESLRVAQRTLLSPDLSTEDRQRQFTNIAAARERYQKSWTVYEQTPKTPEEAELWKQFVPAIEAWRAENNKFLELTKDLEKTGILDPVHLGMELEQFRGDHYRALSMVAEMNQTGKAFEGGEDAQSCHLGRWLSTFNTDNAKLKELMKAIKPSHDAFHLAVKKAKALAKSGQSDEASQTYRQEVIPRAEETLKYCDGLREQVGVSIDLYAQMNRQAMVPCREKQTVVTGLLHKLVEVNEKAAVASVQSGKSQAAWTAAMMFSVMGGGTLVCLALGVGLTLMITRPIQNVIGGLGDGAEQVTAASGQVSSASQSLAEGSSEQAAAVEETSSSLEEMASMTRQNADSAAEANQLMSETLRVVNEASGSMVDLTQSMQEISHSSEETQKIIKTIDEIAFQTNLLALNAAVEAARAGEAGAGFAVVADEVRNLAMRAAEAARNTAELIEQSVKRIQAGTQLATRTGGAFGRVTDGTQRVAQLVAEITAASQEQSQGIDQVNRAVSEMEKVIQQNAANAEESAAAAEELNAQSEQMRAYVDDLRQLVRGSNNDHHASGPAGLLQRWRNARPAPALPVKALGARGTAKSTHTDVSRRKLNGHSTGAGRNGVGQQKALRSEQVIPFEDDDSTASF
jgi:methyl-accepting chemotaxis protein